MMSDIDRRRADVTKALGACAQTEVDVLQITSLEILREPAEGGETRARDIKTEPDAARHVDSQTGIGGISRSIDLEYPLIARHRVDIVRRRKRKDVAVVRQRSDRPDIRCRA